MNHYPGYYLDPEVWLCNECTHALNGLWSVDMSYFPGIGIAINAVTDKRDGYRKSLANRCAPWFEVQK